MLAAGIIPFGALICSPTSRLVCWGPTKMELRRGLHLSGRSAHQWSLIGQTSLWLAYATTSMFTAASVGHPRVSKVTTLSLLRQKSNAIPSPITVGRLLLSTPPQDWQPSPGVSWATLLRSLLSEGPTVTSWAMKLASSTFKIALCRTPASSSTHVWVGCASVNQKTPFTTSAAWTRKV